ncbi:hypothetical protein BKA56DRAFT_93167 [Ilyonectria sp. MPI-CAGE-AT-0026]|nr:hypothetical protein BKA56DRAFT_93167 [Ilyonectria sp. MPI-CAGE-AT-0026]
MKINQILEIAFLIIISNIGAYAGCECFWEGTAPFCDSTCPSGTESLGYFSTSGGGASCWTGNKQMCKRCGPNIQEKHCCVPTHTCAECIFIFMICHEMVSDIPPVECGKHLCGACTGSIPNQCPSDIQEWQPWTPGRPGDEVPNPLGPTVSSITSRILHEL